MSSIKSKKVIWDDLIANNTSKLLINSGAYKFNFVEDKNEWYKWKSGIIAPTYCDCRNLASSFEFYSEIATSFAKLIKKEFPDVELIAGIASSGIIWASLVSNLLKLPFCFARERLKSHGIGKHVYCSPKARVKAVIIDDLCASGDSLKNTAIYLRDEFEIETIGCVSVVNWGFVKMWNNLSSINITKVFSLTSYDNLINVALEQSIITENQRDQLHEFYLSPSEFVWQ